MPISDEHEPEQTFCIKNACKKTMRRSCEYIELTDMSQCQLKATRKINETMDFKFTRVRLNMHCCEKHFEMMMIRVRKLRAVRIRDKLDPRNQPVRTSS